MTSVIVAPVRRGISHDQKWVLRSNANNWLNNIPVRWAASKFRE